MFKISSQSKTMTSFFMINATQPLQAIPFCVTTFRDMQWAKSPKKQSVFLTTWVCLNTSAVGKIAKKNSLKECVYV